VSAEEPVRLRAGEEVDLLRELAEEAEERGAEIAGSFLRRARCRVCGTETLAVPERVATADCGAHVAREAYRGGILPVAGDTLVRRTAQCAGGFDMAVHARDWKEKPVVAPDVTSRDPWPEAVEASGPVVALARLATEHGWRAWLGYSRRGAEELISVRVARPGLRGHAIYRTASGKSWSWQSFKIIPEGTWPRSVYLLVDFQAVLTEHWISPPRALLGWLAEAADRKATADALQKRRDTWRVALRRRYPPGVWVLDTVTCEEGAAVGYDWVDICKIIATAKAGKKEGAR
jgi:hypothetical protein